MFSRGNMKQMSYKTTLNQELKRKRRKMPRFLKKVVRGAGLEPACLTAKDPKSFVSANFTSRA